MSGLVHLPSAIFAPPVDPGGDSAHLVGSLMFRQFPASFALSNGVLANVTAGHSYDVSSSSGDRVSLMVAAMGEIPAADLSAVSQWVEHFLNDHGLVAPGFSRSLMWERNKNHEPGSTRESCEVEIDPAQLNPSALDRGMVFQALSVALEAEWPPGSPLGPAPSYHFNWRTGDLRISVSRIVGASYTAIHLNGPTVDWSEEVSSDKLPRLLRGEMRLSEQHSARCAVITQTLRQAQLLPEAGALTYAVDNRGENGHPKVVALRPSPGISLETALGIVTGIYRTREQHIAAQSVVPAIQAFLNRQEAPRLIYLDDLRAPLAIVAVSNRDALNPPRLKITARTAEERPRIGEIFSARRVSTREDPADPRVVWIDDLTQPEFSLLVSHVFQEAIHPFAAPSE